MMPQLGDTNDKDPLPHNCSCGQFTNHKGLTWVDKTASLSTYDVSPGSDFILLIFLRLEQNVIKSVFPDILLLNWGNSGHLFS